MKQTRALLLSLAGAGLALTACHADVKPPLEDAQFWQRVSVSDAAYQQGPKAQQMLNRDIARCVTELRELERLGMIKNAIPTDGDGRVLNPDELELQDWNTPDRDGFLLMEQGNYFDFHSCMLAKGWERVEHAPYDVSEIARKNYLKAHQDYEYQTRHPEYDRKTQKQVQTQEDGDYADLNE